MYLPSYPRFAVAHSHNSARGVVTVSRDRAMLNCCLNIIALLVAFFNIICIYSDDNGHQKIAQSDQDFTYRGFQVESLIIVNLLLILGVLLRWYVMFAVWICAYTFVIVVCCAISVWKGTFLWTAGISYTSTIGFMDMFNLSERSRPLVAVSVALTELLAVSLVFVTKGMKRCMKKDAPPGPPNRNQENLGRFRNLLRQTLQEQQRRPTVDQSFDQLTSSTQSDGLPAYSDLEFGTNTSSNHTQPPAFDETNKTT